MLGNCQETTKLQEGKTALFLVWRAVSCSEKILGDPVIQSLAM